MLPFLVSIDANTGFSNYSW